MKALEQGDQVDVTQHNGAIVSGLVVDASRFGVCVKYATQAGNELTHWFHATRPQEPGPGGSPRRFTDRFQASITSP